MIGKKRCMPMRTPGEGPRGNGSGTAKQERDSAAIAEAIKKAVEDAKNGK